MTIKLEILKHFVVNYYNSLLVKIQNFGRTVNLKKKKVLKLIGNNYHPKAAKQDFTYSPLKKL